MTRDAFRVANAAAAAVDTIVVTPDSIVVRVGEAVRLEDVVTIAALGEDGRQVQFFAPFLRMADAAIATYDERGVVGRRPGRTVLIVAPLSLDPSVETRDVEARVVVIVVPREQGRLTGG